MTAPASPPLGVVRDIGGVEAHARTFSAAVAAGAVVGFVLNGWGSRFAMMLLARLNPQATGRISDDGFIIGRLTLGGTLNLIAIGTVAGIMGSLVYLAIRPLRFGPAAFQIAALTIGPAVVVGALLVHTGGRDFTLLRPPVLAIGLFTVLPAVSSLVTVLLVERWDRPVSPFHAASRRWLLPLGVLLLPPIAVFAVVAYASQKTFEAARQHPRVDQALRVAGRLVLVATFVLALVDLVRDVQTLT